MESQCEVCKKPAKQKCSGCLAVHYCSPAHQKDHWKSHKRNCSYFVIRDDPEHGKGFYASRDIKAGTIIHEEKPFVFTPFWPAYDVASCVTCGLIRRPGQPPLMKCSRCHWRYCSSECLQIHNDNECKIFTSKKLFFPPITKIDVQDVTDLLALTRTAVAKKKHPEVFQIILQLGLKTEGLFKAYFYNMDKELDQTLSRISAFINADDLDISQGELKMLLKIIRHNYISTCYRTWFEKECSHAPLADYLYLKASQIQHSCVPNCSWVISWKPDFIIRVRTAIPVKKGEPLKINYYLAMDRLTVIRTLKGHWCKCLRCSDPTELGTFTSAVVCSNKSCKKNKDSVGYMLPEDPLNFSTTHWRCNLCGARKPGNVVTSEQKQLEETISERENELSNKADFGALITFCKAVIQENSDITVHPNHWIIQDVKRTIMTHLPEHGEGSTDLQYYVSCGMYLLAIQDVVSPGISYQRAVLQQQISTALENLIIELSLQKKYNEALSNLEQYLKLQEEALAYFKDEFPKEPGKISDADELRMAMKCAAERRDEIASLLVDDFKCIVCGKQAYQNCPQCHMVTYCSTEHREKHWKSHSKSCCCFVVKEGYGNGNGFFASRNIEAGTVILEETPVVYGPSWDIPDFFLASFCVTCGVGLELEHIDMESPKSGCSKCYWSYCSLRCLLIHNENECKIFELAGGKLNFPTMGNFVPREIRDLILLIRTTILKKKNPGIYQQILELSSESFEPDQNDNNLEDALNLLSHIVNSDGANTDPEEFKKIFKILRMNCYSPPIRVQISATRSRWISGTDYVYIKATKLEQSCAPNCSWEITGSPDFKIRIRAAKDVKKGEALTVNYHVRGYQEGTKQRQETIRKLRGACCTCERCKDPSELGTFFSAITCKTCTEIYGSSDGLSYFLPEDPLDLRDSAKWKCNRCGLLKLSSVILPPVEQIQTLILKKSDKCFGKLEISTRDFINYCKTIINKYSGTLLHPNHWVLQNASRIIFQLLPELCIHSTDMEILEVNQDYVRCGLYLLAIQDIVSPGMTLFRASFQKKIGTAILKQNKELHAQKRHKEAFKNLEDCLKLMREALDYYQCAEGEGGRNVTQLEFEISLVIGGLKALSSIFKTKGNREHLSILKL